MPANCFFVVERLMLMMWKPWSTAQRRPASSTPPLPVKPAPRTRTLTSSQSGAKRTDDPGAGGSVTAEISLGVLVDHDFALRADRGDDGLLHLADERMLRIDAAVEDADPNALAGRAAPGPLARDLSRPLDGKVDALGGPGRQAPRRAQLVG